MKIAQFINTLAVADGGPARNSFELNVTFNQIPGIQADLYSMKGGLENSVVESYNGESGPLPIPGPRWLTVRNKPRRQQIGMSKLGQSLCDVDVAIIHGYYLPWIFPLIMLLRSKKIPYVITPHGSLTLRQQQFSRARKAAYDLTVGSWVRSWAQGFVTGSHAEKEDLSVKFPHAPIEVAGVGTPMPQIKALRDTWKTPLQLLSMSRIAPKKRIDVSISALAELRKRGIQAELNIAGEGPRELVSSLMLLTQKLRVTDAVHFAGQVAGKEKTALFEKADIFLLPSEDENFGIGLAESLAHGVPAVTTVAVAAAKAMTKSSGCVLDTASAETVADAVLAIAGRDRFEYATEARRCAEAHYSWKAAANRWLSALQNLKI